MEELRENLIELKVLLENQGSNIACFIDKLIMKIDKKDCSFIDDILSASKIQDFMHYKAAYLFEKIWDLANYWKFNNA